MVNDKISFVNDVSELIGELLGGINENTSNDIAVKKLKNFENYMLKSINNFNSYIKTDTKNNTKPDTKKKDTKNNTESDTEDDIKWDINDTRASIRKNQKQ